MPDTYSTGLYFPALPPPPFNHDFYDQISQLSQVLRVRGMYGQKHHDMVQDLVGKVRTNKALRIERTIPTYKRGNKLEDNTTGDAMIYYQPRGQFHQPCFFNLGIEKNLFLYTEIWHPLLIDLHHVRTKHLSRGKSVFGMTELEELQMMALACSKTLEKIPRLQKQLASPEGLRIFLPDPKGLYMGFAQKIPEEEQEAYIHIARGRHGERYYVTDVVPEWRPSIRIFVGTYVAGKDMGIGAKRFYDAFDRFLDNENLVDAIIAMYFKFSIPGFSPETNRLQKQKNFKDVLATLDQQTDSKTEESERMEYDQIIERYNKGTKFMPEMEDLFLNFIAGEEGRWLFERYNGGTLGLMTATSGLNAGDPRYQLPARKFIAEQNLIREREAARRVITTPTPKPAPQMPWQKSHPALLSPAIPQVRNIDTLIDDLRRDFGGPRAG